MKMLRHHETVNMDRQTIINYNANLSTENNINLQVGTTR